jgi:hypothetical protein
MAGPVGLAAPVVPARTWAATAQVDGSNNGGGNNNNGGGTTAALTPTSTIVSNAGSVADGAARRQRSRRRHQQRERARPAVADADRSGGVVTSVGNAVSTLANGVQSGLGNIPNATNPWARPWPAPVAW